MGTLDAALLASWNLVVGSNKKKNQRSENVVGNNEASERLDGGNDDPTSCRTSVSGTSLVGSWYDDIIIKGRNPVKPFDRFTWMT
jgi:hypothetical protein